MKQLCIVDKLFSLEFLNRFIILSAILISLCCLTSCDKPKSLPTIRFGLAAAPVSLDPRFATDATSSRINRLLYRALVDFDATLRPVPDLARWEQLNPTQYRFYLGDKGRQFHDGSRLTAADVKATYEFILDARNASPHRGSLAIIRDIQVLDENTFDFILTKIDPLFVGRLVVGIVPASLIDNQHPFNKSPVGSGEFQLVAWPHTSQLTLRRLRDGLLVEFLEVKDPVVRVLKLVKNELDILQSDLSSELIQWLNKQPNIQVTKATGSNFIYLGFNLKDPLTGQLPLRQAVAYAIDRQAIIHYLLGDAARPASTLLLPTHWASSSELKSYPYDPTEAKRLLQTIGFTPEQPATLVYKTSNNPFRVRLATVIQEQLGKVGIKVDLRTYDWGTFYGDIKTGRFQMFSLSWVGIKIPDIFRYAFHSQSIPPQGANRGRLQDATIDALIEQAEQAPSLEAQADYYRQIQVYLLRELPYVPLWYEDHTIAINQRLTGYSVGVDGNYDGLLQIRYETL